MNTRRPLFAAVLLTAMIRESPLADPGPAFMAQCDGLTAMRKRLRADPDRRAEMLADVERDLEAAVDPDRIAGLLHVRDWLQGVND